MNIYFCVRGASWVVGLWLLHVLSVAASLFNLPSPNVNSIALPQTSRPPLPDNSTSQVYALTGQSRQQESSSRIPIEAPTITLKQQACSKRGEARDATAFEAELRPDIFMHARPTPTPPGSRGTMEIQAIDSEWQG